MMAENTASIVENDPVWRFARSSHQVSTTPTSIAVSGSSPSPLTLQRTLDLEASNPDKYFEFTVEELQGSICVGLATKTHPTAVRVGQSSPSWGLHCDRGAIFVDGYEISTLSLPPLIYSPQTNFTVGCGVSNYQVFWTFNGNFLGFFAPSISESILKSLFATISVVGGPAKLKFNSGSSSFIFPLGTKKRQLSLMLKIGPSRGNEGVEPKERYSPAMAVCDHLLIAHGGRGRFSQLMSDLCYFDLIQRKWEIVDAEGGDKPPKLYGHSAVSLTLNRKNSTRRFFLMYGGRMLSLGRWKESYSPWLLDIETRVWARPWLDTTTMPPARYAHAACVFGSTFYVFGGYNSEMKVCLSDLQALSISRIDDAGQKHVFKELTPQAAGATPKVPCGRYGHSMVAYNAKLYVFGGRTKETFLNDLWEYDTESNSWRQPTTNQIVPSTRYRHSATIIDEHYMVIIGGSSKDPTAHTDVWVLHLRPDSSGALTWERLFTQIEPIYGHGAATSWGLEEKNFKFRTFARWSSNPKLDRSPSSESLSNRSPSSTRAKWSVGIIIFGGAAETGLNSHPRKISNSVSWMLLNLPGSNQTLSSSFNGELPLVADTPPDQSPEHSPSVPASPSTLKRKNSTTSDSNSNEGPELVFKCLNGNDIRMVTAPASIKLSKLVRKIQREYDEQGPINLKYSDQDGDLVSLSKTSDLRTAVKLHEILKLNTIKLHVFMLDSRGSATAPDRRPTERQRRPSVGSLSSPTSSNSTSVFTLDAASYLWHIPFAELEFKNILGKGYFGEVRRALFRGAVVAAKIIYRHSFHDKHDMELFVQEVDLLAKLRHPKVISFLGASFDGEDKVIVMEYMKYGSVFDALRRPDTRQNILESPPTQLRIGLDIAQGMSYLHSKNVVHRDLTSKNILLDAYLTAKVSDLGLSKIKSDAVQLSGTFGAIPWQAPEVLNGGEFALSADVYSFGCILWEIFTAGDLTASSSGLQLADKIRTGWRPDIPDSVPPAVSAVIQACWSPKPEDRPSFVDIVRDLSTVSKLPEFGGEATDEDSSESEPEEQHAPQSWEGYDV